MLMRKTQYTRTIVMVRRPRRGLLAVCTALMAMAMFSAQPVKAEFIQTSGNLQSYLLDICRPMAGSEGFEEPGQWDMVYWRQAVTALIEGDLVVAAELAEEQMYDLVEFTHSGSGCVYYVLVEQQCLGIGCDLPYGVYRPCRGLGTYVFNPHGRRALNLQVPHSIGDGNTWPESVSAFLQLDATFLQAAGTHRCANAASGCGGTTAACGGSGDYRESDVAHYTENFFQATSTEVHTQLPDLVSISIHGFEACSTATGTSIALISDGTGTGGDCASSAVPNGIATQLAAAYNEILFSLPEPYIGRGAASCNLAPGEPPELAFAGCPEFCGGSNVQGRAINGSTGFCPRGVCDPPNGVERFVHLEQQSQLRVPPPGLPYPWPFPGVSWQISIDAIGATFPTYETWADFGHSGTETGSFCQPYDTLAEPASVANWRETILIKTGSSPETLTIDSRVVLQSYGGSAIIGQ